MEYPEFISGGYETLSVTADQRKLVNWYVRRMELGGSNSRYALFPTPGVSELVEAANGPGRGHFYADSREFAAIYNKIYEINESGSTLTERGTVAVDGNPATFTSNGDGGGQLLITSGSNGYSYDLSTDTLSQVASLNSKATQCDHLDGYGLVLDSATSTVYISDLLDFSTFTTGTRFFQRSASPDKWVALKVLGQYIFLFGSETSEIWYDAGNVTVPFAKHPSGSLYYGCDAPFSVAKAGESLIWLGTSSSGGRSVFRTTGFSPEPISDQAMEEQIDSYSVTSDAVADAYKDSGETFYLITFPTQNTTWQWSSSTGRWAQRDTWISENHEYVAWRPRWHAFAFGKHRMLDSETGSVYDMSLSHATDVDSRPIRRLRRATVINDELRWIDYDTFELDLDVGIGLASGQGSDPQVMMRFSNDGGRTWSPEEMRSAGEIGQYGQRVRWGRQGSARRRVYEISMTDPIPWRVTAAYLGFGQQPEGARERGRAR